MPASRNGRAYDAKATPQHDAKIAADIPLKDEDRNKVPDIAEAGKHWYVCATAPQRELKAAQSLRAIEVFRFLAYVPCEFFWRRPERGNLKLPRREIQRPAMRSYIFVGAPGGIGDRELALLRERDAEGRNRHGLVSILGSNMRGALPMGPVGLNWLGSMADAERRGATAQAPKAPFERGDTLRIATGPLTGFPARALLIDMKAEEVVVEISLLGSITEARYAFADVHRAA
ncbi:UNVERIFIED_CONTAM: transcription termination/antitermination NusG family protein [Methylobacteriaceae bacterium AG10]|nr:transcription termination/antitermination NusG family protein [Methylobacteriaceae bacterium AG10]